MPIHFCTISSQFRCLSGRRAFLYHIRIAAIRSRSATVFAPRAVQYEHSSLRLALCVEDLLATSCSPDVLLSASESVSMFQWPRALWQISLVGVSGLSFLTTSVHPLRPRLTRLTLIALALVARRSLSLHSCSSLTPIHCAHNSVCDKCVLFVSARPALRQSSRSSSWV